MPRSAKGHSHGKIILMGEHSVVYGEPAIALPFTAVEIVATTTESAGEVTISSDFHTGDLAGGPPSIENLRVLIKKICENLEQPLADFHIDIQSTIPAGRGLGSSAAVAGAVIRALYNYFEAPLSEELLLELMDVSERISHGNPSGLDARIASSFLPVYFEKDAGMANLPVELSAFLIVGDTGKVGDTLSAVSNVSRLIKKVPSKSKKAIKKLGTLAQETKEALINNDPSLIGRYMTKAHSYLSQLQVSSPSLDRLVTAALDSGALGAKLTGGGHGGCMIALADTEENALHIAQALREAGALNTWIYSLETGEKNV